MTKKGGNVTISAGNENTKQQNKQKAVNKNHPLKIENIFSIVVFFLFILLLYYPPMDQQMEQRKFIPLAHIYILLT